MGEIQGSLQLKLWKINNPVGRVISTDGISTDGANIRTAEAD
jgi:hypothetical protein